MSTKEKLLCNRETKCYGICSYDSNSMKSSNPYSGIYETDTTRTLDLNGGNPACNQGGIAVVEPILLESNQNHATVQTDGVSTALPASMGMGGGYVPMICLEGNGQRESHKGDGYKESDVMYTLNTVEQHAVAYREQAHPRNALEGQGYEQTDTNDTLNCTDNGESRTPTIILENHPNDSRVQISKDNKVQTLSGRMGTGGGNTPMALEQRDMIVRRLTPLECERLQGFPIVRKVRFTEMTKDEYIAWNINEGNIVVDTEYGKVFATRGPGGIKLDEPKELTGSIVNGYRVVSIRNGETKMQCHIHRIVWIAEHGIIPDGYVIDHINNDKQDNRLCNLQLLTAAENSTKARKDGLYKIHGEAGQAKITDEVHDLIQHIYGNSDLTIRQLSDIFGISKSRVYQIVHDEAWTDIGDWYDSKGKLHKGDADSPRYKALGNSIALPFWQWMAERMVKYIDSDEPTMASLFDGIGGFPLVYSRVGCKPLWASEIEEFPIAVTKKRIGDELNEP